MEITILNNCFTSNTRLSTNFFSFFSWVLNTQLHSVGGTLRLSPRTTFACSPPVRRLVSFSPTCSLLLPWQASPTGNVGSEAANPVVSTPHRLCTSGIPKPLSVSLVVTPPRHYLPALPSEIGELRQNRY